VCVCVYVSVCVPVCVCVCVCVCMCVCEVFLPSIALQRNQADNPSGRPAMLTKLMQYLFSCLSEKRRKNLWQKKWHELRPSCAFMFAIAVCLVAEKPASSPRKCVLKTHILGDIMLFYFLICTKFICLYLFPARSGRL
jgi:hypothetical protein